MLKSILAGMAALIAITLGSNANAADFISTRTVPTSSIIGNGVSQVDLSITTDGTVGLLSTANISSWLVQVSNSLDPLDNFTFTPGNSFINVTGSALFATTTSLAFDFASTGSNRLLFYANGVDANGLTHFYCFETGGSCSGDNATGEAIYTRATRFEFSRVQRSGIADLGTISEVPGAVPEPSTWALMLVGFGLVGGAMRSAKRRQTLSVSYA